MRRRRRKKISRCGGVRRRRTTLLYKTYPDADVESHQHLARIRSIQFFESAKSLINIKAHWANLVGTKSSRNVPLLWWQLRFLLCRWKSLDRNISRSWVIQDTVHVNYQIHVTIDKQVAVPVVSECVRRKNGRLQECCLHPSVHGSNTLQLTVPIFYNFCWPLYSRYCKIVRKLVKLNGTEKCRKR